MTFPNPPVAKRMRRQARIMRLVNVPMRRLLRLPFPTPLSRRLMLVTLVGRKTGRVYLQPVSYVRDGDVLLTPGGGKWTRNLREGEPTPVRIAGRQRVATAERLRERAQVMALLQQMIRGNPRAASFMPFVGPDGRVSEDGLSLALEHGFCVVRWSL